MISTMNSDGTYVFDLLGGLPSSTTFDTTQGSLAAGGPDAVQTLLFGGSAAGHDYIVFFGAVATAPKSNVAGSSERPPRSDRVGRAGPDRERDRKLFPLPTLINAST